MNFWDRLWLLGMSAVFLLVGGTGIYSLNSIRGMSPEAALAVEAAGQLGVVTVFAAPAAVVFVALGVWTFYLALK